MAYIKEIQKKLIPVFKKNDVVKSSVFGSVARGENLPDSDVDILIQFKGQKGLFEVSTPKKSH